MPMLSIAENMFLGNEQATARHHRLEQGPPPRRRTAAQGRPARGPRHADHQYRHRQAAAGRDRQGARQGRQALDPRRADGVAVGKGQPGPARPAARVQGAGHDLDHDQPQAQRDQTHRRPDHGHPRRPVDRDHGQGRHHRGPHRHLDGRPLAGKSLPGPHAEDRRDHLRGEELVGLSPDPPRAADHQERQPVCPQGRGRRHRRPDGRRANRAGDERLRPHLRHQHHWSSLAARQASRHVDGRQGRGRRPSPTRPRTAKFTAST